MILAIKLSSLQGNFRDNFKRFDDFKAVEIRKMLRVTMIVEEKLLITQQKQAISKWWHTRDGILINESKVFKEKWNEPQLSCLVSLLPHMVDLLERNGTSLNLLPFVVLV